MTRLRWLLLGALVLAGVGVIVAAVLGSGERPTTAPSLGRGQLLAAEATIAPASQLFGSAVHVRVDAIVDRSKLDPNRVVLQARWDPYQPVAPVARQRTDVGSTTRLRWTVDLHCVIEVCAPDPGSAARKELRPGYVRYLRPSASAAAPAPVKITWPELTGFSRLDPIHLQRNAIVSKVGQVNRLSVLLPPWHLNSLPIGSDTYRISPTALFWLSLALAAALVAAAFGLARPWLPYIGLRRHRPLTRLEQALVTVERARGLPDEKRKALELLAEELRSSGLGGFAGDATELAWSQSAPERERTAALTSEIRRDLERRGNGHRV